MFCGVCSYYALTKGIEWGSRDDPTIFTHVENDYYPTNETINLNKLGFNIAFGVVNYKANTVKPAFNIWN